MTKPGTPGASNNAGAPNAEAQREKSERRAAQWMQWLTNTVLALLFAFGILVLFVTVTPLAMDGESPTPTHSIGMGIGFSSLLAVLAIQFRRQADQPRYPPSYVLKDIERFTRLKTAGDANSEFGNRLYRAIATATHEVESQRGRLDFSYRLINAMSLVLFVFGLVFLAVSLIPPLKDAQQPNPGEYAGMAVGGTSLMAILLINPVRSVKDLMGDMTRLTLLVNAFECQVALRLMQYDSSDRRSVGDAAFFIQQAVDHCLGKLDEMAREEAANVERQDSFLRFFAQMVGVGRGEAKADKAAVPAVAAAPAEAKAGTPPPAGGS